MAIAIWRRVSSDVETARDVWSNLRISGRVRTPSTKPGISLVIRTIVAPVPGSGQLAGPPASRPRTCSHRCTASEPSVTATTSPHGSVAAAPVIRRVLDVVDVTRAVDGALVVTVLRVVSDARSDRDVPLPFIMGPRRGEKKSGRKARPPVRDRVLVVQHLVCPPT